MLVRFDPFRELDRLAQQALQAGREPAMPMDAFRRGGEFLVSFDLPGVDPGSIDVSVERNVLTVAARRTREFAEGDEVIASERATGSFTRQLLLGDALDTDRVEAAYENGVLTVRIPVADQAKPRKVPVVTGGSRQQIAGATREAVPIDQRDAAPREAAPLDQRDAVAV